METQFQISKGSPSNTKSNGSSIPDYLGGQGKKPSKILPPQNLPTFKGGGRGGGLQTNTGFTLKEIWPTPISGGQVSALGCPLFREGLWGEAEAPRVLGRCGGAAAAHPGGLAAKPRLLRAFRFVCALPPHPPLRKRRDIRTFRDTGPRSHDSGGRVILFKSSGNRGTAQSWPMGVGMNL